MDGAFPALIRRVPTNIQGHVGVPSAKNRGPAGFAAPDAECPLGAIVGAVELTDCVELDQSPRKFLDDRFGCEVASFYPEHFLPDQGEAYVWLIGEAIPDETPREFEDSTPRTWAKCNTWIEGERVSLWQDK